MNWTRCAIFLSTAILILSSGAGFCRPPEDAAITSALNWIDSHDGEIVDAAQSLHSHPETPLHEHHAFELLTGMLERGGFTIERNVAGMPTAFVATYGSGHPVIGILAEYDALPGLSQKAGDPLQTPVEDGGPGHGCGHNLFGAGSVGAALAVKEAIDAHGLAGTVVLFGCPAEETGVGKVYMARDGVFNGADACLTWHPATISKAQMAQTIAMNNFEVSYTGKTAHGAADPWNGRSALDAVELMNIGVNYLREHVKPTVRIHYVVKDGGLAPNIVPDHATVWYFVRDSNRAGVEEVYERVQDIAKGAALMTGTEMKLTLTTGVYEYLPNLELTRLMDKHLRQTGPPEFSDDDQEFARSLQHTLGIPEKGLSTGVEDFDEEVTLGGGSSDVADVSWIVPTSGELGIAAAPSGIPWHSWAVTASAGSDVGMKAAVIAAKVIAASTVDMMLHPEIVERAQAEFRDKTADFTYQSAVPDGQSPPLPE